MDATAPTASAIRSLAMEHNVTTAFCCCPRSGGWRCVGCGPLAGAPKTVTISREADGWYVGFSCAEAPTQPLSPTRHETGVDLGSEAFATLSEGRRSFPPGWYRQADRALNTA